MSITSRINEMSTHIEQAYDELQGLGADLTNVNKNIENISMILDDIYDDLPKVTGSGTSITLDDTRKGRLESTLSGNTSQFTTTGKNLYPTDFLPVTEYGITISKNANGDIVLNGTPNFSEGYKTFYTGDVITVEAGTYTLSVANKIAGIGCVVGGFNGGCNLTLNDTVTSKSAYADTPQNVNPAINIRYDVGTLTNFVLNPQMEKSSSATTYEPFTNGASPNPDYPQEVHVVSGDNEINVNGKNFYNSSDTTYYEACTYVSGANTNQYKVKATGTDVIINLQISSGTSYSPVAGTLIHCKYGETIYYDTGNSNFGKNIVTQYNSNKVSLGFSALNTGSSSGSYTPTNSDCEYISIRIGYGSATSGTEYTLAPIFSKTSNLIYEPYQGNTYNIDLPVENLLPNNGVTLTRNGITFTVNDDGSYTLNGTSTANTDYNICQTGELQLEAGTYTLSSTNNIPTGMWLSVYEGSSDRYAMTGTNTKEMTFSSATTNARAHFYINSGITLNNLRIYPMIQKGTKANSYTPYGTTPIELAEISTYNDEIFRTSGKNLFDNTYNNLGMWVTNIGETTTFAQGNQYLGAYCKVEPGTYTISRNKKTNRFRIGVSPVQPTDTTSSCYVVASNDNASSITIDVPQGNNYICIYLSNNSETSTNVDLMIEKGTTATEYNPYGTGEWYYKEAIKKVVLNGTETISAFDATSLSGSYQATFGITARATTTDKVVISDKFISALLSDRTTKTNIVYSYSDGYLRIATNVANTMAGFKTWLGTNNPKVLLEAATPTYNKITYEPLLEQLEAFYNAKSKNNQTNITQENNDLPFIISASALKEWSE